MSPWLLTKKSKVQVFFPDLLPYVHYLSILKQGPRFVLIFIVFKVPYFLGDLTSIEIMIIEACCRVFMRCWFNWLCFLHLISFWWWIPSYIVITFVFLSLFCLLTYCWLCLHYKVSNQVAHVHCGNCRTTLMYPYGAPSVKCALCQYVTNVNVSIHL